jgi:hypothetical protein
MGWRHGRVPRLALTDAKASCKACGHPEHDFAALPPDAYPYLLGLYLGDGCITKFARTYRLTIVLDRRYQSIVSECARALGSVVRSSKVCIYRRPGENTDEIYSYSKAWPCLLPQHGAGKKHLRRIRLVRWQKFLIDQSPERLLRGLIHSDGCRSINVIKHPKRTYAYPRYEFTNKSDDIRQLFCDTCDLLGIEWRVMNAKTISVARRESVRRLDRFIGPKR